MTEEDITALAKGAAPFIRECVADICAKAMLLPADIAEQVASAVRMLHEAPPIAERSQESQRPAPPRITRVERDENGNFVPVYDAS